MRDIAVVVVAVIIVVVFVSFFVFSSVVVVVVDVISVVVIAMVMIEWKCRFCRHCLRRHPLINTPTLSQAKEYSNEY